VKELPLFMQEGRYPKRGACKRAHPGEGFVFRVPFLGVEGAKGTWHAREGERLDRRYKELSQRWKSEGVGTNPGMIKCLDRRGKN